MKKTAIAAFVLMLSLLLASCNFQAVTPPPDEGDAGDGIKPKNRMFYEYFDTVCVFYDYTGGTNDEFTRL